MNNTRWRLPAVVLLGGCLISLIGFGVRSPFGLYLGPMTSALGWDRETYALAMAIQNLLWGVGLPVAGALADRYGSVAVIAGGAFIYTLGILGMSMAESAWMLHLTGGLLVGIGVAFTSFQLAIAAMVRVVGPAKRSLVMGAGTAAGSVGQVLYSPLAQSMIVDYGWSASLMMLAMSALVIVPLALLLPNDPQVHNEQPLHASLREALVEAFRHRGYLLLTAGFFVCGFHVAFITVHLPAYVTDLGLGRHVGAWCISLIGLFNIAGSFLSGWYGQHASKKFGLSVIYLLRALVLLALLLVTKTEYTMYVFAGAIGMLWLATIPLTTGIVAQIFGVRYMATLFGVVFLSHQIGSFTGVWMGGWIHDRTGSYDLMWQAGIVLGLVAAVIHLPINEKPLVRQEIT
ncbi:MAG: MFS transporter [Arenicellales bacterium]|nr:MFS transporter [Arenicellales bacterium]